MKASVFDTSTICAVSTPAGQGGIAVIRVSGSEAVALCDGIFTPAVGKPLKDRLSRTVVFGTVRSSGGETIDEALATVFRAPHSYTGEDTVEISCHGSTFIQREILKLLVANGCRTAVAGEFTRRAFLNGKLDLSQAEAVSDLIASSSEAAHKAAMRQMRGDFSSLLAQLREELLHFASMVELELDFGEEDVAFADRKQLLSLAGNIEKEMTRLSDSFATGNAIKNGIPVAIIGETNAGKSTLLNRLLHEDRAIVSDIHGTTRDAIEDVVAIGGALFRFADTAGIRHTGDSIEQLGIERAFRKMEEAAVILWVIDVTETPQYRRAIEQKLSEMEGKKVIVVYNKTDKASGSQQTDTPSHGETVHISAKTGDGLERLEAALISAIPHFEENDIVVTSVRHYEALMHALHAIRQVIAGLQDNVSGDLLAQDIRECIAHLGSITGQYIHAEDVLENIFKNFCIGK
jgi:tRNA modification GTPase